MNPLDEVNTFAEENGFSCTSSEEDRDVFKKNITAIDELNAIETIHFIPKRVQLSYDFARRFVVNNINIMIYLEVQFGFRITKHTIRNLKQRLIDNRKMGNVMILFIKRIVEMGYCPLELFTRSDVYASNSSEMICNFQNLPMAFQKDGKLYKHFNVGLTYYDVNIMFLDSTDSYNHNINIKRETFEKLNEQEILDILLKYIDRIQK